MPRPSPVPDATITAPQSSVSTCQAQAIQNGIEGDGGAIVQVIVLNNDCTWSTGQALVAYDVRGPPVVDVMVQSAGVSVDVETQVKGRDVRLSMGYETADGVRARAVPSSFGARAAGTTQTGNNDIGANQDVKTTSGDARSGTQRVRVGVDRDAASIRILAQNVAPGASALSGDAISGNTVVGVSGPQGLAGDSVQTGQAGDNAIGISQNAESRSGDASAGVQEITVVVDGSVDELAILADNQAPFAVALSGDAISSNNAIGVAGPSATSVGGTGQAAQVGDNTVSINQRAIASSGDAIAGAQVIGVVVSGRIGKIAVLASNNADGTLAASGLALATNAAGAFAGPRGAGLLGGSAGQVGDNVVQIGQVAQAQSGDAVSGAQVIGIAAGGGVGSATVMPSNSVSLNAALSGAAIAGNLVFGQAGPQAGGIGAGLVQQSGSNLVDILQDAVMHSGDAIGASQIVGVGAGGFGVRMPAV